MILIFVASLNENIKLASRIEEQLNDLGKRTKIVNLIDLNLPMYDTRKEKNDGIPAQIYSLVSQMESSDGYVFVSPEYNGSLPPVVVNYVAWVSRMGDDFRKLFSLKTIQLATHSGSGGISVLNAMRNQFTMLGSILMPRDIVATYQTPIEKDRVKKILTQFVSLLK